MMTTCTSSQCFLPRLQVFKNHKLARINNPYSNILLLIEEILHHLGCVKPCKEWDKLPINWVSRISSINSIAHVESGNLHSYILHPRAPEFPNSQGDSETSTTDPASGGPDLLLLTRLIWTDIPGYCLANVERQCGNGHEL